MSTSVFGSVRSAKSRSVATELGSPRPNSVQTTSSGSYLALDPAETQSILAGVRTTLGDNPDDGRARDQRRVTRVALLTSVAARRYLRKLIELEFPTVRVISPEDLDLFHVSDDPDDAVGYLTERVSDLYLNGDTDDPARAPVE